MPEIPQGLCSKCHEGFMNCKCDTFHPNSEIKFLFCNNCGKCVSTGFIPIPTDTPDKGIIVRAWIECPECIERHSLQLS